MPDDQEARLASRSRPDSPSEAAAAAKRAVKRLARPSADFDASRYFRGTGDLGFYNVGTGAVRALARSIDAAHKRDWTVDAAVAFADVLIRDRYLDVKAVGIEVVRRRRREFVPRHLPIWKGWLADGHSANWATTDGICGYLIGPLLAAHPKLAGTMLSWSRHQSMWVRRAAAVGLLLPLRQGLGLDLVYLVARRLHADEEDLIQKAVGWMLREAGKVDSARLERYLKDHGPSIPRTTIRYAIEKMSDVKRRHFLAVTRPASEPRTPASRALPAHAR